MSELQSVDESRPALRARQSRAVSTITWGVGIGGSALVVLGAVLLVFGQLLPGTLTVTVGALSAAAAGCLLWRERTMRVCPGCGHHGGALTTCTQFPADEERYLLAVLDSGVFDRMSTLEPCSGEEFARIRLRLTYCDRCHEVGELEINRVHADGVVTIRGPVAVDKRTVLGILDNVTHERSTMHSVESAVRGDAPENDAATASPETPLAPGPLESERTAANSPAPFDPLPVIAPVPSVGTDEPRRATEYASAPTDPNATTEPLPIVPVPATSNGDVSDAALEPHGPGYSSPVSQQTRDLALAMTASNPSSRPPAPPVQSSSARVSGRHDARNDSMSHSDVDELVRLLGFSESDDER